MKEGEDFAAEIGDVIIATEQTKTIVGKLVAGDAYRVIATDRDGSDHFVGVEHMESGLMLPGKGALDPAPIATSRFFKPEIDTEIEV
jgi:hypothetical protein